MVQIGPDPSRQIGGYRPIIARWLGGQSRMGFADNGIPQSRDHSERKADRVAVNAEVALRRPGQHNYRVRAYDASPFGCKLEFVERPELAERVWVKFEGLDALEGQVCWVDGFVVGVEYARAMHPAVFDALIPKLI